MKNELRYDTRHPLVILDSGKCIKCGICVKISNEVLNNAMVGFKERGFSTRISTPLDAKIEASMEEFKMVIENCPTGALAWRDKKANLR
jgi:predicted molibdopterin-dependent oxidoreductase YjgC